MPEVLQQRSDPDMVSRLLDAQRATETRPEAYRDWMAEHFGSLRAGTRMTARPAAPIEDARIRWLYESQPSGTLVIRSEDEAEASSPRPLTPAEQIGLVNRHLGLGKSQIARIFGVSRQTIYDWLKGIEPTGTNAEKLAILARAMQGACGGAQRPLYHRYVTESTATGESSIVELLEEDPWNEEDLAVAFARARRLTTERDQRLGQEHVDGVSHSQGEANLLDNSIGNDLE